MSKEDQELLERIAHLAGQINRHKNESINGAPSAGVQRHRHFSRGRVRAYIRGGHYGQRNRTMLFNHGDGEAGDENKGNGDTWVSKHGRHLQLINTAAYEREAERSRSNSRPADAGSGDDRETNRPAHPNATAEQTHNHQLEVDGIKFQVTDGGRTLVRVTGPGTAHPGSMELTHVVDSNPSKPTPETAVISNIKFQRNASGNLERVDAARGRWVTLAVKYPYLTPASTTTATKTGLCKKFSNTGQCRRGPRCSHIHDPDKVAICRDFLRFGKCPNGAHCDLSHECSNERVPACSHFQRGLCNKDDCRYAHVHVNPAAAVCRSFSTFGYCEKGSLCQERHVFECPDYASSGQCTNPACRLPHIDRAGKLRLSTGGEANAQHASSESPSDSPVEEEMIPLGSLREDADGVLSQQDDFIKFS